MVKNNVKTMLYLMLTLILVSGVNAQTIDLNEPIKQVNKFTPIIDKINNYEIVEELARNYNSISVEIENYTVVLEFNETKLENITEFTNETVDLKLHFTREDIKYLVENYETMSNLDKIKFFLRSDMPIKDIITFGAIAVGMR